MERGCGILLPMSAVPNNFGFGCFSKEAYDFVDFLAEHKMKYWQILPMGVADKYGSPYGSVSTFAGGPLFIDLEKYLTKEEIKSFKLNSKLNYVTFRERKDKALHLVYEKLHNTVDLTDFMKENEFWIKDYAVFRALRNELKVPYLDFPKEYKNKKSKETKEFIKTHEDEISFHIFNQYLFFTQWKELKTYANNKGIKIIGDAPIYCLFDNADLYSNPECFELDKKTGKPNYVGGAAPDYFNANGQVWNLALYNFDYMKTNDYEWWVQKLKHNLKIYDFVRIDHFIGLEAYFKIPAGDKTAKNGFFAKGPGIELFNIFKKNGIKNLVLEDLGHVTEDMAKLRDKIGFPGMKILQFAFDGDMNNEHLPHNYIENTIAYPGNHDNNTFMGFLKNQTKEKKAEICKYFELPEKTKDRKIAEKAIETMIKSKTNASIFTLQDVLFQGEKYRTNTPGMGGNDWMYQAPKNYMKHKYFKTLDKLIEENNR